MCYLLGPCALPWFPGSWCWMFSSALVWPPPGPRRRCKWSLASPAYWRPGCAVPTYLPTYLYNRCAPQAGFVRRRGEFRRASKRLWTVPPKKRQLDIFPLPLIPLRNISQFNSEIVLGDEGSEDDPLLAALANVSIRALNVLASFWVTQSALPNPGCNEWFNAGAWKRLLGFLTD